MTEERIKRITDDLGYCNEEYAVVNVGGLESKITRQEYDDEHAQVNGELITIGDKAQLRCRFLTPFNFVVAAKFSSINSNLCDRLTRTVFDDILKGSATIDDLHQIILSLPKPPYRRR